MEKKLKEKLNKASALKLYDKEWVEQAADKGFKRYFDILKQSYPENVRPKLDDKAFVEHCAVLYYTAFEDSLNTFLMQVLDDNMHEVSLAMDELFKVTASIIKKRKEPSL